ncbi:hypothetical protein ACVWZ6_002693 [Bradyrhizobium sp. GM6.1]
MNLDSAKELAPVLFSDSYAEARQKFLSSAPGAKSYPCSTPGPSGDVLYTDAAWYGPRDARKLLLLISGTHGPEGYCGSASQLLFLRAGFHEKLPPSTAVLFVHALNCYGFAWDRRVTAEGCDLNRNFIDFSKPEPSNPGYEELHNYIVCEDISDEAEQRADAALDAYKAKHGVHQYQIARSSGQYTRPGGAHYGGSGPTEARRTLEQIVADYDVASREHVVIVDYHTGLGRYGYGELQCEHQSGLDGYERAKRIFGLSVTSPDIGTSSSVELNGTQAEYWERILGDRHTYVALEYGTLELMKGTSRKDLWLFRYRPQDADTELGRSIRKLSKAYFYPQYPDWQEMILCRSHQVHRQALEAFNEHDFARST